MEGWLKYENGNLCLDYRIIPQSAHGSFGKGSTKMTTILIVVLLVVLLGGGGYYGRGRYW